MRVTKNKVVSNYVTSLWLGGYPVWSVWYGGRQIFPDDSTYIVKVAVRVPRLGEDGWEYWVHTMDALQRGVSGCGVYVEVGGEVYEVGVDCAFDMTTGMIVFTGGRYPVLTDVVRGGVLQVRGKVPARNDAQFYLKTHGGNASGTKVYELPFLSGMTFTVSFSKGRAKNSAGVRWTISGLDSKTTHYAGNAQKNGHGRGTHSGTFGAWNGSVVNGSNRVYNGSYVVGDMRYQVYMNAYSWAGYGSIVPRYPAFERVWDMRVMGIVVDQKKQDDYADENEF